MELKVNGARILESARVAFGRPPKTKASIPRRKDKFSIGNDGLRPPAQNNTL